VTVDEIITMVNIALGNVSGRACPAFFVCENENCAINQIIAAVNISLNGCSTPTPTRTPTPIDPVPGAYEASGLILGPGGTDSEFLVGTLDIAPPQGLWIPNTIFMYAVENSQWHSDSFEIVQTGDPGGISASTFSLGVVGMSLTVLINGEVVPLSGGGDWWIDADLRLILFKVNLTGGGYTVTLTAIPGDTMQTR
jgi:hypothetical protein